MVIDLPSGVLNIREFAIVIAAKNHNPTILNPDFLVLNEIAGDDWELAGPPICVEPYAQVLYANGISVVSDLGRIVFTQAGNSLAIETVKVVQMAERYVKAVPHVGYRELGINPKGDIEFNGEEEVRQYIMETLIAPGPWKEYGRTPVRVSTSFIFQLERARLFLTIQEAELKQSNGTLSPVVTFAANFHYELKWVSGEGKLKAFASALGEWPNCWEEYINLVTNVFRPQEP